MKKEICERIIELGGTFDFQNKSFRDDILSISFSKSFLKQDFYDYMSDEQYACIKQGRAISESDIKYPRITFQAKIFTPCTQGSDDYAEWNSYFYDIKEDVIAATNETRLEFLCIGDSNGFPNYYFLCLSDNDIENPAVFSTDHEAFFNEIEAAGTFEDFLNNFVSDKEYRAKMGKIVGELRVE